jgi:hypothetical protein
MINIQPITFNYPSVGQQIATQCQIQVISDNLSSSATFSIQYITADNSAIGSVDTCVMDGEDYISWNGSNIDAISFVCNKKNIIKL